MIEDIERHIDSMVECQTNDRGVTGSRLISDTELCPLAKCVL